MTTPDTAPAPELPWDPADPYTFYQQRRRDGGVVWDDTAQAWLILGYHPARQILGGSGWTSNPLANPDVRSAMAPSFDPELFGRSMLFTDGADHSRLRGAVRDVFTPQFIAGLRPGIEAIASAVIGHPSTGTVFDFMLTSPCPCPSQLSESGWVWRLTPRNSCARNRRRSSGCSAPSPILRKSLLAQPHSRHYSPNSSHWPQIAEPTPVRTS